MLINKKNYVAFDVICSISHLIGVLMTVFADIESEGKLESAITKKSP